MGCGEKYRNCYSKYRNEIHTGDLIQFAAKDILSRIIAWKTKNPISHSAMAFWLVGPTGKLRLYVLEGVTCGLFPAYLSNRVAWYLPHGDMYWHKMRPEWQPYGAKAADKLLENVGKYYDYQDLILQAFKRVTLNPVRLYCSEVLLYAWSDIISWPKDKPVPYPGQISTDYLGVYEEEGVLIT